MAVYTGHDLVQINHLFINARKVFVFLKLGEYFCQNTMDTGKTRISQLEQDYALESQEIHAQLEQIYPQLKQLMNAKEKLDTVESKMNVFQAECVLKTDIMEKQLKLLKLNEHDILFKKNHDDAVKAVKVAEARFTIVQHVYQEEKIIFDSNEKEINDSAYPLKKQVVELEQLAAQSKSALQTSTKALNMLIAQAIPKLEEVQKAISLVKDHTTAWADAVFTSPFVMGKEVEVLEALCDCVKYLLVDFIPDSIDQEHMDLYSDDLVEMNSIQKRNFSSVLCTQCKFPILCKVDDGSCASICLFCPQEIPNEPVQDVKEEEPLPDIATQNMRGEEALADNITTTDAESTVPTEETPTAVPMDSETMAKITKEAGVRILSGWVLKEDLMCLQCENPMMCDKSGMTSICLLCDVVMQ
jgi:hypothetical protein